MTEQKRQTLREFMEAQQRANQGTRKGRTAGVGLVTEDQAIERIGRAISLQLGDVPTWCRVREARAAWSEMKAIAQQGTAPINMESFRSPDRHTA